MNLLQNIWVQNQSLSKCVAAAAPKGSQMQMRINKEKVENISSGVFPLCNDVTSKGEGGGTPKRCQEVT